MWHLFCFIQEQELGSGLGAQYRISLTCSAYSPSLLRKGQPSGAGLTNFGRGGKGKMFSRGHRLLLGLIIVMAVLLWGFVFHGSDAPRQAQITGPFTPGKTSTGLADTPKKVIKKRSPMPCSVPRKKRKPGSSSTISRTLAAGDEPSRHRATTSFSLFRGSTYNPAFFSGPLGPSGERNRSGAFESPFRPSPLSTIRAIMGFSLPYSLVAFCSIQFIPACWRCYPRSTSR